MRKLDVAIYRSEGRMDYYQAPYYPGMTVLNVVESIYTYQDPTLAYRYSCRTGLCGTCSMMINGRPGLSCMKPAETGEDGCLTLAPLPRGETLKDLMKQIK
ncbi:2Fe-2S iron-sulfur cluster-binding protein [Salibacterium aidingense]|uniref:2Fe-2S iron-sulfur cluster-binding protein n=1 Tax=Salibacterium aidingense TaxID=384933 RepID=UPI000419DBB9|nr:2Fe-2S iron-sulfur cluster-binding protein [Salibacterium aidingense]